MCECRAHALKEQVKYDMLRIGGCCGVGVGSYAIGKPHHLKVYVSDFAAQVPSEIEGVKVVKKYVGQIKSFDAYARPVLGGASVSTYSALLNANVTGTDGMGVLDANGEVAILGCNHVLAGLDVVEKSGATVGQPIWSPGSYFSGNPDTDTFATLSKWKKISAVGMNETEWALAKPVVATDVSMEIRGIGTPIAMADPHVGTPVVKSGAITGVTLSHVIDDDATVLINYEDLFDATYDHQIVVENGNFGFSAPGDSGSAIIVKAQRGIIAVGMVIGGSSNVVVCNSMTKIQAASGFTSLPLAMLSEPQPNSFVAPILAFVGATGYILTRKAL